MFAAGFKQTQNAEMLLHVDENNIPLGPISRGDVRKDNLWHRASYIFVMNSSKQFAIHKRTDIKDYCPSYWDTCCGGCIGPGETDGDSARRELEEEYGIKDTPLEFISSYKYADDNTKNWASLFFVRYDGEIICQPEEVEKVEWVDASKVLTDYIDNPDVKVTPDGAATFKLLMDHYSHLIEDNREQIF